MSMSIFRSRTLLAAVAVFHVASAWAQASNTTPEEEYRKLIRVNEDIQPLGEDPFGESVNLYDGRLSFSATDISLAGTGPLIRIGRTFQIESFGDLARLKDNAFGDWDIDIPRISTIAATQQNVQGWMVVAPNPRQICTKFGPPPGVNGVPGDAWRHSWQPQDWWHGYQLIVPGAGSQDLLARNTAYAAAPQVGSTIFPAVTKQNWQIGCLPQAVNDTTREAFLAIAPDGTQYRFDYLATRWAAILSRPVNTFSNPALMSSRSASAQGIVRPMLVAEQDDLYREEDAMLATRVTDRFGNWVSYGYDGGKLVSVDASDGRKVSLTYDSGTRRVHSITVQGGAGGSRTWTYAYAIGDFQIPTLTSITQPDGSTWQFNLATLSAKSGPNFVNSHGGSCSSVAAPTNVQAFSGSITHPSGLTGTFVVKPTRRGRSYVYKQCFGGDISDPDSGSATYPNAWYTTSIVSKTFSGAGMGNRTWNYALSPSNESWDQDCAGGCATTVWTDVTNPDGSTSRHEFSNRYDITESRLLASSTYAGAVGTTLMRKEWDEYAAPDVGPFPAYVGEELQKRMNEEQTTRWSPVRKHVVVQDGNTYISEVTEFDAFAQPVRKTRYNDVPGQSAIDERTEWLNDVPHWVLGLPSRTYSYTRAEEISHNVYDSNLLTLSERYRFGRKVMSYAFNTQGQLASFTDGNGHTTGLENYYRGIPRTVRYPDGTAQTIAVDDLGQITAIADQTGALTSYSYDAIGRLARIDYPSADSVAWAPKTFQYYYLGAARGIDGSHWVRLVTQGNWSQRTDYDAMLRPVALGTAEANTGAGYVSSRSDYDWAGRKTFQSYAVDGMPDLAGMVLGTVTRYDALGRPIQQFQHTELGDLLTTTDYLAGGARRVTDPRGNATTTRYQLFDQPSSDNVIAVEAPEGVVQTIQRDIYGNPLSITQGGQGLSLTKTMTYDGEHRLCRTWEPESGSEIMAYDGADNLAWSVSGASFNGAGCGQEQVTDALKTVRGYDAMNRVTSVVYPAGTEPSSFTYDARGNPATATAGMASWTFGRNKMGLLTAEVLSIDGWSWALGYGYDAKGTLSTIAYPNGDIVSYLPNGLRQPTQASGYASGVSYFADGDVKSYTLGNGAIYTADKNARQLLRNFTYGRNGTPNVSEDFAYDANGNVSQINDVSGANQRSKAMGYDGLNRLVSATASQLWGTESYTYDTLNNIRTLTNGSGTASYNYDGSNLLRSIGNGASVLHTFNYDARGNTTAKDSQTLNFDLANRLTSIPGKGTYTYDAAGRRVKKVTPQGTTYYAYSAAGQLMWELDPATRMGSKYVYLGKKLIAKSSENIDVLKPAEISTALGVIGVPRLSADGSTIEVTLDIVNRGSRTLTGNRNPPVQMGYHLLDASGTQTQVANGVNLPNDIPPGQHGTMTLQVAAAAILGTGKRVRFSLVQGGPGWFQDLPNNTTVDIGPYSACPTSGTGNLCNNVTGLTREQVDPLLTITAGPTLSADGQNVLTTIDIANRGTVTLASMGPYPVNLGNHLIDAAGNMVANDVTRQALPEIAPGQHVAVTIATPASQLLGSGRRVQFELVQEGLRWFHDFGIVPLVAGPYVTLGGITSSSDGSVALSWQPIAGATSYVLRENLNGGSWTTVSTAPAPSWSGSGRATGTYGYQVQACAANGCAPFGSTWSVNVLMPPPAPAGINVPGSSSGSVAISWPAAATATSYQVEHSYDGNWTQVYSGTATSATIAETLSTNWYYRVRACNASGCGGYATSSYVVVTLPPASAPTLYGAGTSTNGAYTLSWTGVGGATVYNLVESANGGGWQQVLYAGSGSWSTTGRGNGNYVYQVQACNAGGCGPWSNQAAVRVALPPAIPSGVSGGRTGPSYKRLYEIHWNAAGDVTNYQVERTVQSGAMDYQSSGTTPSLTFVEESGDLGQISMRVRACNASGCSGWSDYVWVSF